VGLTGLPSLRALDHAESARIWLAAEAADMRCSFDRLAERVRQSHLVATDDTTFPMQAKEKTQTARMWVYVGDDDHRITYSTSRSIAGATDRRDF
jgi:uncharacterized protein YpmB